MSRKRGLRSIGTLLALVVRQGVAAAEPALTAPSNVSAVGSFEHRIDVSWRDNSSNETGFEIHRSADGPNGPYTLLAGTVAQAVSWVDGGLSYSTAYCYKVRAIKIGRGKTSYSAFSGAACATTLPPAVPEAPSNVQATTVSESAITVSWRDNSTVESGFEVFRSTSGPDGAFTWAGRTNPDATSYLDTGLLPSTPYCYKVRALRSIAVTLHSDLSSAACATTSAPPVRSQLQITASTSGVDPDADGYRVDVWRVVTGGWIGVDSLSLPPNGTVTVSGLHAADHQVTLRGIAMNCDSEGANPRVVTVGPPWAPPAAVRFDVACAPVSQIAFVDTSSGNSDISIVNSNGTGATRLSTDPASDTDPDWSPDGTRLAFRSDRDGGDEIYIMNADGSSPERLTHAAGGNAQPAWSPDGTKIAFTSHRDGNGEIYVMNADGSDPVNITNHPAEDGHPTWSPDGTRIAFSSTRDQPFGYPGIFVADAAGSTVVSLSSDPYAPESEPSWSPDGAWLAMAGWGVTQTIWLRNLVDGSVGVLTVSADLDCEFHSDPVWAPDSLKVAFTVTNYCSGDTRKAVHAVSLNWAESGGEGTPLAAGSNPSWRR
jgi:WD40 repeat protein/fibronectin type III domain protein